MTIMTTSLLVHCILAVFLALVVTATSSKDTNTSTTSHGHGEKALTGRFIHVTGTNNNKAAFNLGAYIIFKYRFPLG